MSDRTRKAMLQAVVILGAVVPFVVGAVSQFLMPPIDTHATTIDSNAGPSDEQKVWYDFGDKAVDRTGIKYALDYRHALARAKLSNQPVFLYFTGITDTNSRMIHKQVLCAPAVIARVRQFECAVLFVDIVPSADRAEVDRLVSQNWKLLEEWLGDVTIPAFAVVYPDFEVADDSERRKPLALAYTYGEFRDEAAAARFLDEALVKWARTQRP